MLPEYNTGQEKHSDQSCKNRIFRDTSGISKRAELEETLVGPPSAVALEQLRILRDDYGWILDPDPFD